MAVDISQYVSQFGKRGTGNPGAGIGYGLRAREMRNRNRMAEQQRQDEMQQRNRMAQADLKARQEAFMTDLTQTLESLPPEQRPQAWTGGMQRAAAENWDMDGIPMQWQEGMLPVLQGRFGVAAPGAESEQGPRFGTINPRDYTAESLAQYQQSGDFRDLQRYESQRSVDIGGVPHRFDPASGGWYPAEVNPGGGAAGGSPGGEPQPGAGGDRRQITAEDVAQNEAERAAAVTKAQQAAKSEVDKASVQPKVRSAALAAKAKVDRLSDLFDSVSSRVSNWTAGPGAALANIPASDARDLRADLDTIKANMGFAELQEMRDNSPTGGALGQVTEREIAFLQALVSNLEQSQSPEQLRRNLATAKQAVMDSWGRVSAAYEQQYGTPLAGAPAGDGQAAPKSQQQTSAVNWGDL